MNKLILYDKFLFFNSRYVKHMQPPHFVTVQAHIPADFAGPPAFYSVWIHSQG